MKLLATIFSVVAICIASITYFAVRGSLPTLDGTVSVPGLSDELIIERDDLGVPTVRGRTRVDVARATGFLHAQDRFFQMDLMRRLAAGELSELVGSNAISIDRDRRQHRLRVAARARIESLSDRERDILVAYAEGVNAGLLELRVAPFEYILLRARTEPWQPEDTILVNFAMYFQLNDSDASRDAAYAMLHDGLPTTLREFVLNEGTEWDAPLIGGALPVPPPPEPGVCDLRDRLTRHYVRTRPTQIVAAERLAGSNGWAVAASRSSTSSMQLLRVSKTYQMPCKLPSSQLCLTSSPSSPNWRSSKSQYPLPPPFSA